MGDKSADIKVINGVRHYLCSGEWMPSVTGVLGAVSPKKWGKAKTESGVLSACDRGTAVHLLIEKHLRGKPIYPHELTPQIAPYWDSLQPCLEAIRWFHYIEEFVHHREKRYAGTLDAVVSLRGKVTLTDWKTTGNIKNLSSQKRNYKLQLCAYAAALEDTHGFKVEQAALVVAHPDGPATELIVSREELAELWPRWCAIRGKFDVDMAQAERQDSEKRLAVTQAFSW